ncbi:hypothetical protein GLOIN_2v1801635 [Rhizophagus clarus]|uniref:Uncharacterized protein n=1 Tax=Rhizophagus clarus TaxID=94130 RepID=A0A8H3LRC8_9GLOM|nr:hypothetical protein GLOIN_2v1801635 [Rhizophagus clarus]
MTRKCWFVVDFSNFEVLPLHKELSEFIIQKNFYNELEKTQQKNISVGYIHLQNNILDESSWVLLLSGYVIYTSLGGLYFKLSIERNGDYLQFFWQEFGKDFTFANCKAQEETLVHSLKQKSIELEQLCEKNSIIHGIKLEKNGKNLSPKFTQALMVMHEKYKSTLLSHPCSHCYNTDFQKKSYHVSCIGFNVTVDMDCQLCGTMDSYSNQSKGTNFSHLVASSTLAAEESAKRALKAAITHTITKGKKALTIGFDCSWSHSRNAKQASGEFVYLEELEDYGHKAVVAFHVVEKSRIIIKKGKDGTSEEKVVIHQGNIDASSRQMEHAILIALLEQIIPILEESDLLLEVCIDRDLDSNKTLANVPIVSEIYAYLKHASKNI